MVSEKKKLTNRKWDKDNMKTISCRLRMEDAELFKEYCDLNGTTPAHFVKEHIMETLDNFYNRKDGDGQDK